MATGERLGRLFAALSIALLLGACNPAAIFRPGEATELSRGWYEPEPQARLAERYCYRTLAEVDCHAAPLAGEERRRVGFWDAPLPL